MALAAVLTQTLLPRVGGGRVPAAELLMVGYGARQHIRKNQLPASRRRRCRAPSTRARGIARLEGDAAPWPQVRAK
jgi:hypothetical protein